VVERLLRGGTDISVVVEVVERPLPKPSNEGYVEARLLEALVEARLALRFLEEGLTRNAAGKAFQAWKVLLAALLRLELDKLKALAGTEEERRWLESKAVPRVPTTKMKPLARLLEAVGHDGLALWAGNVLLLHDYQYHGPDPSGELSKYATREDAVADILSAVQELARRIETFRGRVKWGDELEKTLQELKQALSTNTP
jgi:ADP-ribose pyrophosphatase YjhB (NUDIX family)